MTDDTDIDVRDDAEFDIEIVDDVPADRKPRKAEDAKADIPDDDEIEKYSESVQKRIKQLKFEFHEAERQKQEAIRLREEAINYARSAAEENKALSARLTQGQTSLVENARGRLTAELEQAKRAYKTAYENGDADDLLEAQQALIRAQGDLSRVQNWKPAPITPRYTPEQITAYQQQHAASQAPQLNESQRAWLANNQWFGQDEEMTGAAYGLHERLVKSGVDPNSKKYYDTIDSAMRSRFPEKFDGGSVEVYSSPKRQANVVAPATRSASNPRKVRLTSTQVSLAKRLGLSPERYAAQLLKDAKNG